MTQNNNLSVVPFYNSIDEQNHRRSYAYGDIYPLYAHVNSLPPFQIIRTTRSQVDIMVSLYTKNGIFVNDLTALVLSAGLQVVRFEELGYDVIVFPSNMANLTGIEIGQYYIKVQDGVETWFSDIITFVTDITGYLCLEWYSRENMVFDGGQIVYNNPNYINRLYLCTELGKPEYKFEEEGEERDGFFFPEKQISEKKYKCNILAPEYLCDVMRFIRLSDVVEVLDQYGHRYNCDTFLITPKWETQGDLASVEIEFTCDTVAKKIGYVITGGLGDYNDDYNNDYNN